MELVHSINKYIIRKYLFINLFRKKALSFPFRKGKKKIQFLLENLFFIFQKKVGHFDKKEKE